MKSNNNNGLRRGALFSLFITSYVPLFAIVIGKQIKEGFRVFHSTKKKMGKNNKQWGFLRETKEAAEKAGIDKDTGVCRTGLDEYLEILFPGSEWIHDLPFGNHGDKNFRIRPDYRCEKLKLIVEFDGIQHYQKPDVIRRDVENQKVYESYGYTVVRIPYFIQLTNEVVKILFGLDVTQPLFPESIPSMGPKGQNTPAYCCPAGVIRMAEEFLRFPQQLEVNMDALNKMNDEMLSGANLLGNIVAEKKKEKTEPHRMT